MTKKSELVTVTKSATCADANLYGILRYFSGKSRDNCPVSKEDLTLGKGKEAFLLSQDDSLWNNRNGSSRDCVFDRRATILTVNLLNAEQNTQLSIMTQRTLQGCRFILLTFPEELLKFFKGKKEEHFSSKPGNCKFHLGSKERTMFTQNLIL